MCWKGHRLCAGRGILTKLLLACTTQCPFQHIDGNLYLQQDGVAMGSPLEVTFANYYMCHIENKILDSNPTYKPAIYCRYTDDIFIVTPNLDNLLQLKTALESNSVLRFTHELGISGSINFLDVHIDSGNNHYITSVYQKPTNPGIYINYLSECPQWYKDAIVTAMIHRTYKTSSDWNLFHQHIKTLKQGFVNN